MHLSPHSTASRTRSAFTLVELLVATTILLLLMLVIFSTLDQTSKLWRNTTQKVETFQGARAGFEALTRNLAQATLNAYWKVDMDGSSAGTPTPRRFTRLSDLHFITGPAEPFFPANYRPEDHPTHAVFFQAPVGYTANPSHEALDDLLAACGYFVEFSDDLSIPKHVKTADRFRYRLFEMLQPSEELGVYAFDPTKDPSATNDPVAWIKKPMAIRDDKRTIEPKRPARPMAENIIALVVVPKMSKLDAAPASDSDLYAYSSRDKAPAESFNQLPPIVQVTLVAIDETSALRTQELRPGPTAWTTGLFENAPDEKRVVDDLKQLKSRLDAENINYRVFSTDVNIRGSKWSHTLP